MLVVKSNVFINLAFPFQLVFAALSVEGNTKAEELVTWHLCFRSLAQKTLAVQSDAHVHQS